MTFNIRNAYHEQAFRNDVEKIVGELNLAQDLLVLRNMETEIQFYEENHVIKSKWTAVGALNQPIEEILKKGQVTYTHIKNLEFENVAGDKSVNEFTLKFLDQGYEMSGGLLKLVSWDERQIEYLFLRGSPHPIKLEKETPDLFRKLREIDEKEKALTQMVWFYKEVQDN